MKCRDTAIVSFVPATDLTDKEGYFVKESSGTVAVSAAATDIPVGVVLEGTASGGQTSVACTNFGGTVRVKLGGTVTAGNLLQLSTDGTVVVNAGSGARVIVARALESGTATELIEAAFIGPIVYAS